MLVGSVFDLRLIYGILKDKREERVDSRSTS